MRGNMNSFRSNVSPCLVFLLIQLACSSPRCFKNSLNLKGFQEAPGQVSQEHLRGEYRMIGQ